MPENVISAQIYYAAAQVVSSKEFAVYGQRYILPTLIAFSFRCGTFEYKLWARIATELYDLF